MMQRVDVVRANISHIKQISEIESRCIADGWSEKLFIDALENEKSLIFSALDGEKVIGFLNGSFVLDEAELLNIAVDEKYRKNGIAQKLLEAFENELIALGIMKIYLEARESNLSAIELYKKTGFIQNGMRKNYYKKPCENAILMIKEI